MNTDSFRVIRELEQRANFPVLLKQIKDFVLTGLQEIRLL
jgi:hypothetical protein